MIKRFFELIGLYVVGKHCLKIHDRRIYKKGYTKGCEVCQDKFYKLIVELNLYPAFDCAVTNDLKEYADQEYKKAKDSVH